MTVNTQTLIINVVSLPYLYIHEQQYPCLVLSIYCISINTQLTDRPFVSNYSDSEHSVCEKCDHVRE